MIVIGKEKNGEKNHIILLSTLLGCVLVGCVSLCACNADEKSETKDLELNAESKEATQYTKDANDKVYTLLDFDNKEEYENASKGLIASPEKLEIFDENGKLVWSQAAYSFVEKESPDTANPSLWRNTQLNHYYGLFEVSDGIYQVRGYDYRYCCSI